MSSTPNGRPAALPAFLVLRTSGPDPARDAVLGLSARRGDEHFERDLETSAGPLRAGCEAREALEDFLGNARVVVPEAAQFRSFLPRFDPPENRRWFGLDELCGLMLSEQPPVPETLDELSQQLTVALRGRRRLGPLVSDWMVRSLSAPSNALRAHDVGAARWLERALWVLQEVADGDEGGPPEPWPRAAGLDDPLDDLVALAHDLTPRWTQIYPGGEPFPPRLNDPTPFPDEDFATVDRVFETELPKLFGNVDTGYRAGQHDLARAVGRNLGFGELLVVHAPTGTGKTLGYLVPAVLWAQRHGVRVGVSTYTRALQEQAMNGDVPQLRRALTACAHPAAKARIHALKGRSNYICWRSLLSAAPVESQDPEPWLAWSHLMLFALVDDDGDLDHFHARPTLGPIANERFERELTQLVRHVRAGGGCCNATRDRQRCAAEVARHRAERSHVVVTNHSFVLARPEFFRNVVFDECEHLHDQAASAWSSSMACGDLQRSLERLREPSHPMANAPLNRLADLANEVVADELEPALDAWQRATSALKALDTEVRAFVSWRKKQRDVKPTEEHVLFPRYVTEGPSTDLLLARAALTNALTELDLALVKLHAILELTRLTGRARLLRSLEIGRSELAAFGEAISAWIPFIDGRPHFDPTRLYDVEEDRKVRRLVARILCPNEHLGRHYYPELESGAFLSATTWLRGGFDCALGYLGLDRTREPAEDEEREGRDVTTLRAPSPFDYGRALVCVPTDAPSWSGDKDAFHDWVRRFIADLGERTRGRVLALFTNASDVKRAGSALAPFFRARKIPFWFQGMPGTGKEDLPRRFRERDSVLCGVDTFWFGADFPGRALEYLVIVRLPYGPPDRFHHAQAALFGRDAQRRKIYLPRALAKFRQGFGRLMRRVEDKGVVFVLDNRILSGRHQVFLRELPLAADELDDPDREWEESGAELVRASRDDCLTRAFEHMELKAEAPLDAAGGGLRSSALDGPVSADELPF